VRDTTHPHPGVAWRSYWPCASADDDQLDHDDDFDGSVNADANIGSVCLFARVCAFAPGAYEGDSFDSLDAKEERV
jgi:hypothetical protein